MSKKLVIKINNLGNLDEDALASKHQVEHLLWGRIIGTLVIGIVLLVLAAWFIFSNVQSPEAVKPDGGMVEARPNETSPDDAAPGKDVVTQVEMEPTVRPAAKNMPAVVVAVDTGSEQAAQSVVALEDSSKSAPAKAASTSATTSASVTESSNDDLAAIRVVASQPMPSAGDSLITEKGENEVKIKLLSDGIAYAQLTQALDNEKKPVDRLTNRLHMNAEGLLRVYLYTELKGLAGTTLYHTWYLNGDRMARVRIPVVRDEYRASSSKFINTMMLGAWQVIITDDNGKSYADVSFAVSG